MRGQVILDDITGQIWPTDFNLDVLKTSDKLTTLLEVVGSGISQTTAISCHCTYMAVVTSGEPGSNLVFVIHLVENRYYLLKKTVEPCTTLAFHPYQENVLFIATESSSLYRLDVNDGSVMQMIGHTFPVEGIHSGARSPLVISYNSDEVLLWSWPSLNLTSRLRLEEIVPVKWAGHVWQRDELVVSFVTGGILIWPSQNRSQQITIHPPEGLQLDFTAYALSSGGEWLVGGGKSHLLVTYSLINRSVAQVVQLPASCTDVFRVTFLPAIHPRYFQVLAVLNSTGILTVIDFTTSTKLKTLRAQRFNIVSVNVSEDGSFLAVTYANSTTKLYPTRALFPSDSSDKMQDLVPEVKFQVIENRKPDKRLEEEKLKKREKFKKLRELLEKTKWYEILREFNEYPDKYRSIIWVSILDLPRNYSVFSDLLDKGVHPAYERIQDVLNLSDGALLKMLKGTLSALAHWAPFLASVEYLPEFVFPFVKFFHSNPLLCFEAVTTVILNWCQSWFEFWPKPGVLVLNVIEQLICDNDSPLLAHLMRLKVTAEEYAWSLLVNAFSRVVSNEDWLVLWDHILSNPPAFLPCVAAAFILKSRQTILTCSDAYEIKTYLSQESWMSVRPVLDKAYILYARSSSSSLPKDKFGQFTALPRGGLPFFSIGPRDARDEEREKLERSLRNKSSVLPSPLRQRVSPSPRTDGIFAKKQEDMVYLIGRKELQKQEEECLDSIRNLRKRHLAVAKENLS